MNMSDIWGAKDADANLPYNRLGEKSTDKLKEIIETFTLFDDRLTAARFYSGELREARIQTAIYNEDYERLDGGDIRRLYIAARPMMNGKVISDYVDACIEAGLSFLEIANKLSVSDLFIKVFAKSGMSIRGKIEGFKHEYLEDVARNSEL